MPDEIPSLSLGLGDNNEPIVLVGATGRAADMAALLRLVPGLASEGRALDLARAVNHFAHGDDYRVIANPAEFANAYRAQIEREDPAAEWQEGVIRLRDYGLPDFNQIEVPKFAGGKLTFYAVDAFLGVPYKVEAANLEAAPTYTPMPLTPLPRPLRPEPKPEIVPAVGGEAPATANVADSPQPAGAPQPNEPAEPEEDDADQEEQAGV
jgi:hypothetical protein